MAVDPYNLNKGATRRNPRVVPNYDALQSPEETVRAAAPPAPYAGLPVAPPHEFSAADIGRVYANPQAPPPGAGVVLPPPDFQAMPQSAPKQIGSPKLPAVARIPGDLPQGVRSAGGGIYEGKTGLAGERVFSDNAYDPLLTQRTGGNVGLRRRLDPGAASAVLSGTPQVGDRGTAPVALDPNELIPHYNFADNRGQSAGTKLGLNPGSIDSQRANTATPQQIADLLGPGASDADIGNQIAANQRSQIESRVQREPGGLASSNLTGAERRGPDATGTQPPLAIKDILGIDAAQRANDLAEKKLSEDPSEAIFNRELDKFKGVDPAAFQAQNGMSPDDAASIATAKALFDSGKNPESTAAGKRGVSNLIKALAQSVNDGEKDITGYNSISQDQLDPTQLSAEAAPWYQMGQYNLRGPAVDRTDPEHQRLVDAATPGAERRTAKPGYLWRGQMSKSVLGDKNENLPDILRLLQHPDVAASRKRKKAEN